MNDINKKKVIGVILAYKHASFLEGLYEKLPLDILDEVIITNDESGDNTEEIAKKLGIPCFSHSQLGYGGNMKYGMKKALERGADYVVEIHGDGQYDPSFIRPALEQMRQGCDLVLGTRFIDMRQPLRDGMPMIKYIANICLTFIQRFVIGVHVSEFHTGARIYSKKAIEASDFTHTSNNFLFGFESIAQIGYHRLKVGEVPVRCYYNQEHTSISLKNSAIYAIASFKVLFFFIIARLGFRTKLFHK
ncbi:MAG: glycosyltransferase family 2 protein [Candidatus Nomurabacteria bacterium]|nr:glycosyltransferase family 2 protein [Candidatus Nomurabacteria bacterium]